MQIFGMFVSLFVVAYVAAFAFGLATLYAIESHHDVVLPKWVHHGTLGRDLLLVAITFLIWFGFIGLLASIFFSADWAFVFAFCAGFASLLRRNEETSVWA